MTTPCRALLRLSALAAVAALISSCSSSGSTSGPPGGSTDATAGGGSVVANAPAGDPGNPLADEARLCSAIKQSDAQALMTVAVAAGKLGGPTGCTFVRPGQPINGDNLAVTLFLRDSTGHYARPDSGEKATPVSGVGDTAVWTQVVPSAAPELRAHKRDISCVVLLPADLSVVKIDKTGSAPIFTVSGAAAAAFATREGALCTDVFAAAG